MDLNKLLTQVALGTLPKKYKLKICQGEPNVALGNRKYSLCGDIIIKGEECYRHMIGSGRTAGYINICMDCSYVSIITATKI